ncbi:Asp/Glu/hydantoin racemase [Pseudochelatococcus lubricantis]|uniref:Asp/Glu/hydantoin racemase n=3 Tax=Pseudochelatococcus lubricantis TaxID=1538102 RepID=A0ABX0V1Q0_9HYPH|nr:aspartate/glutamate racemase family protein [Pseudochelatococcus lubricantis]NIJ58872.1 Asp/Glu/hydantoin racemase [Pseudochelatococcus lubricantis]
MRIFWQSFVDASASAPYMTRLQDYLNGIAAPGVTVEVAGISPPDRDFGRLSELRCAILAIDNGLAAEDAGYDAVVMGHFQDPGLYELRASLRIPVIGTGEASFYAAAQLGRRFGLVTLDSVFETWHLEQAALYGLEHRVVGVRGLDCTPADFSDAFAGDDDAHARMCAAFAACAQPLVDAGADVVIPAGVLPGLLLSRERGLTVGRAPVINCAAVALKSAEMWVQLHRLNGIEPSRGPAFALSPARAREDFRALVARGRGPQTAGGDTAS